MLISLANKSNLKGPTWTLQHHSIDPEFSSFRLSHLPSQIDGSKPGALQLTDLLRQFFAELGLGSAMPSATQLLSVYNGISPTDWLANEIERCEAGTVRKHQQVFFALYPIVAELWQGMSMVIF